MKRDKDKYEPSGNSSVDFTFCPEGPERSFPEILFQRTVWSLMVFLKLSPPYLKYDHVHFFLKCFTKWLHFSVYFMLNECTICEWMFFYFREVVEKNMGIFHNFCHEVSLAMNYLCQLPNYMHEIVQIYTILTTRTMIFELGVHKVTLAFLTSELATEGSIKRALLFFLGITLRKTILVKRLSPKSKLHFWL